MMFARQWQKQEYMKKRRRFDMYYLIWTKNGKTVPTGISTEAKGIDAGDKLWHSLSKAEQDELDELCLIGLNGEILKRWK